MLNAAMVGLGWWGQELVNSIQIAGKPKGDKIQFTAGVVRNLEKSAEYAMRQGLRLTDEYKGVLGDPDIDVVVLTTPHSLHELQVIEAAQARKHVFVEKPLALTSSGAERARVECEKAGVVLALGHNRRFLPAVRTLKCMVDNGILGTILHVEGNFSNRFGFDYPNEDWRANRTESPAGGMTAGGIHMLDLLIHIFGKIGQVQAISTRQVLKIPVDDTTTMLLRFASGISGYLGTMTVTARNWSLFVFGTKGWVHMKDHELLDLCLNEEPVEEREFDSEDIEKIELERFADAVVGASKYPVSLDEVVHGIAVLEAISSSSDLNGEVVKIHT